MTLTIEIAAADELRVTTAFGTGEDPRIPATAEEMTLTIKQWLSSNTLAYEQQRAAAKFRTRPLGLTA